MYRCLQLALMGSGAVAPNPLVGAVLVHNDRIIGEGYHAYFGGPHAEVACLRSVQRKDEALIREATLYVSLEPCVHTGKTPPCTDLVLQKEIPRVVIGCVDPYYKVSGKGISKLQHAGVAITVPVLEQECLALNRSFFHYQQQLKPYVLLKWAQSADGLIAAVRHKTSISSAETNRLVHRWRSECMSILVGTNTALFDDPQLTTRLWPGPNPVRLVLDMGLRLPAALKLFDGTQPTLVFNKLRSEVHRNLEYCRIDEGTSVSSQVIRNIAQRNLQSLMVEGGGQLLQTFIDDQNWDEARVITNTTLKLGKGIAAPVMENAVLYKVEHIGADMIQYFRPKA